MRTRAATNANELTIKGFSAAAGANQDQITGFTGGTAAGFQSVTAQGQNVTAINSVLEITAAAGLMGGDADDYILGTFGIPSVTAEMGFFGQFVKDWRCQSKGVCFEILRDNS